MAVLCGSGQYFWIFHLISAFQQNIKFVMVETFVNHTWCALCCSVVHASSLWCILVAFCLLNKKALLKYILQIKVIKISTCTYRA